MKDNKTTVIICDDEDDARKLLREYIDNYPQLEIIKECSNGYESADAIDSLKPQLVFLDIQMPGLTGFEVLEKINYFPQIIFSTAFDAYALKAFDNNAIDYLLKPYTRQRFAQAIYKIADHRSNMEGIRKLSDQLQSAHATFPAKVLVESGNKMMAISTEDIFWIEAYGDYTRLYTEKKFFISNYGISVLEQKLNPAVFMRIHRSAMINVNKISSVVSDAGRYHVELINGFSHKVGRTYVELIRRQLYL